MPVRGHDDMKAPFTVSPPGRQPRGERATTQFCFIRAPFGYASDDSLLGVLAGEY